MEKTQIKRNSINLIPNFLESLRFDSNLQPNCIYQITHISTSAMVSAQQILVVAIKDKHISRSRKYIKKEYNVRLNQL